MVQPIKPITHSIIAKTHPSYYLIHKYWARKPHNVVRTYIEHYSKPGEIVLDPFVGSGVSVIEAVQAGRKAIGIDVNPVATLITYSTAVPIDQRKFESYVSQIQLAVEPLSQELFRVSCASCGSANGLITHVVWANRYRCPNASCSSIVTLGEGDRKGQLYRCPNCKQNIPITRSVYDEVPVEVWYRCEACNFSDKRKPHTEDSTRLQDIQKRDVASPVDSFKMLQNWRLLIFGETTVKDFFTKRNLIVLTKIVESIERIPEYDIKQVFRCAFTASVAQASKLVAYRAGLTTGGPAWTVSGFWIPNVHFEINAWNCFRNRLEKVLRGKISLSGLVDDMIGLEAFKCGRKFKELKGNNSVLLLNKSVTEISREDIPNESVDYIFADPPYGDSVPYLEYGQLWYSWFGWKPDLEHEIIISNSTERSKDTANYGILLESAFKQCYRVLKKGHWLTITFHNKDIDTWRALLTAVLDAGFDYVNCTYQIPAVIPAKAQLVKNSSTKGDVIINFVKSPSKRRTVVANPDRIRRLVLSTSKRIVAFRGGKATEDQVWRGVIMALLENGGIKITSRELTAYLQESLIKEGGFYSLRTSDLHLLSSIRPLEEVIVEITKRELLKGNISEKVILSEIYDELTDSFTPEMEEVIPIVNRLLRDAHETGQVRLVADGANIQR